MNARDELAKELAVNVLWGERVPTGAAGYFRVDANAAYSLAGTILAAGYRKPWTITTAAERATLQPGTICMDEFGNAWKRGTGSWVSTGEDTGPLYDEDDIELTVLHEGTP